jgi:hypothetical protein
MKPTVAEKQRQNKGEQGEKRKGKKGGKTIKRNWNTKRWKRVNEKEKLTKKRQ